MREDVIEPIATSLEFLGVATIVLGILAATLAVFRGLHLRWGVISAIGTIADISRWEALEELFAPYRRNLLRVIVLGLTFLVAGDIVSTASVDRTPTDVGVLAGIVVIREFLSVALAMETTGRWPWQEREPVEEEAAEPGAGLRAEEERSPARWRMGLFGIVAMLSVVVVGLLRVVGIH